MKLYKILNSLPAIVILISGGVGIYASYSKLAEISYAGGIILLVVFLLYVLGLFLEIKQKRKAEHDNQKSK